MEWIKISATYPYPKYAKNNLKIFYIYMLMWMSHSVFQHILPPTPHCGILHIQCIHDLWPYIKYYTTHIWQSWVEIKHYSIAYFDCITTFKALWRRTSVKGSYVLRRLIRYSCTFTARTVCMSLVLNRSSVLQRFERGNAVEIHNGIMFDFYLGLPQLKQSRRMQAEGQKQVQVRVT